jgi:hypothetical protein
LERPSSEPGQEPNVRSLALGMLHRKPGIDARQRK